MTLDRAGRARPRVEVLATGTGPASRGRPGRLAAAAPAAVARRTRSWPRSRRRRQLGLVALGGLASYAARAAGRRRPAPRCSTPLLPEEVDQVLIQADLTAVAPGPADPRAGPRPPAPGRRRVARPGDRLPLHRPRPYAARSTPAGPRTRCTRSSTSVSRTPVPQPLTYLVDDAARTFGTVRVGHAEAFLRADDEAALDRGAPPPAGRLARAAPDRADRAGQHHARSTCCSPGCASSASRRWSRASTARVHVARPDRLRARRPRGRAAYRRTRRLEARLAQVVTAIRAGDRVAADPAAPCRRTLTPIGSLAALREAVEAGTTVLIAYVDNHGVAQRADRRPAARRRRLAHRARPPRRRRPRSSPSTGSRTSIRWTALRRLGTWISSGTPSRRQRCSTRS